MQEFCTENGLVRITKTTNTAALETARNRHPHPETQPTSTRRLHVHVHVLL